ncbi:UDP-glycosyltransferase 88A1 [Zea mays]|uniref:UDP-glycosyltransferase 88A1 n=2 Tax=Zea mays TaxID=4577 RepID=A0A1D6MAF4_MAIZE|nr:UDP-glycosyltransferase 88A1 [Zea mays]
MVELSELFLRRGLAVTVVVVVPPAASTDASSAVARAVEANPSINFHMLPLPPPNTVPPAAVEQDQGQEPPHNPFALLRQSNAPLRDYLRSALQSASVCALVLDIFCVDALDVAADLGVPAYLFYTSGASSLAVSLHMPQKQAEVNASFGDIGDAPLCFPGVPAFRPTELPVNALDRDNQVYRVFLSAFERVPACRGMLVNTFEWLEPRVVAALRDGACVPGRPTPPVYCVGPLVSGGGEVQDKKHACLVWLDAQPENSVVFLCFGSMGSFSKRQLEAIATGLEMSGQRFLATGAFVTHCGWNSILEGITAGVPLLCWPLYAEQRLNKVFMVEDARVGVEIAGYDGEVVTAEEVEAKVRWVMHSEDGRALRGSSMAAKEKALEALQQGGTSHNALLELLSDLGMRHSSE